MERLAHAKIFEGLGPERLAEVYPLLNAHIRAYKKGALLVHTGDIVESIGLLLEGGIALSREDFYGASRIVRKVLPLEVFTAEAACTPLKMSPFVVSCTAGAKALFFPYSLLSAEGSLPDGIRCLLLKNLLDILANNNIRQFYKIEMLSNKSLRDRIIFYLLLQERRNGGRSFAIALDRRELAEYLCVDRSALSRELGRMQKEGLIRFYKNRFEIVSDLTGP